MRQPPEYATAHEGSRTGPVHTTMSVPPQFRLRGGNIPRKSSLPSSGHAGRRRSRLFSLVAFMLLVATQLAGCPGPLKTRMAFAATTSIYKTASGQSIQCLGSEGELRIRVSSYNYTDTSGYKYRCVHPSRDFENGTFTQEDISKYHSSATVHKCALAQYWCEKNVGGTTGDSLAQIFIWKVIIASGETSGIRSADFVLDGYDSAGAWTRFNTWYAANKDKYDGDGTYWSHGEAQPVCRFWAKERPGRLKIVKSSSRADITDNNSSYALKGAVWSIWRDEACTKRLSSLYNLVATEDGTTNTVELAPGTYWVRETGAPAGYALDRTAYEVTITSDNTTSLSLTDQPHYQTPEILLLKRDAKTGEVAQGSASLEGAEFTVRLYGGYRTLNNLPASPISTWTLRTDAKGAVKLDAEHKVSGDDFYLVDGTAVLPLGTLVIQETKPPRGYLLEGRETSADAAVPTHLVRVDSLHTVEPLTIENAPIRGGVRLEKSDADLGYAQAQGDASLAGVRFSLVSDNELPVVVGTKTYTKGQVVATITTDENGVAQTDARLLPYGTYTATEAGSPVGYLPNSRWKQTFTIEQDGVIVRMADNPCVDEVIRGGVRLGKVDAERSGPWAQGDATLEGARFAITLQSAQPVVVDGTTYTTGQVVKTLTTNEEGVAATGNRDLPYGTYSIRETQAPRGYLLNEGFAKTFSIRDNGKVVDLGASACADAPIRGSLAVGKVSRETHDHLPQGDTALAGATLTVTLESDQPVLVNGSLHHKGEVVYTLTTDDKGYAATSERALPYGTYSLREVEAPRGYLLNDTWQRTVEVREDGAVVDLYPEDLSVDDQIVRGSFHFNKVDEENMERLAGAVFRVRSDKTGEAHIVVADENGIVDTEQEPHSLNTNANDAALSADGTVDESALVDTCGIWFSGRADVSVPANDSLGALPYDTYVVEELPTAANADHKLVSFSVRVHKDGHAYDMGTVDDKQITRLEPKIGTSLTYGGTDHVAPVQASVELVDLVSYAGLEAGAEYELVARLVDRETGEDAVDAGGAPITATRTFTAPLSSGTADVHFVFDASQMGGTSLVAFETLRHNGETVAVHQDLEDAGQTVTFPRLGTTLTDTDGKHEVAMADEIVLVDTVAYAGLQPGRVYEVTGTLQDKDTGVPIASPAGATYSGSTSFAPKEADGTVEVRFTLPGSVVAGHTVVAFEELRRAGTVMARHADLDDIEQTVRFPTIHTALTDTAGHRSIETAGEVKLVDTVTYAGLTPGATYTVSGTLHDKASGKELVDAAGKALSAKASFKAEDGAGTVEVTFTCDASLLAGKAAVAFETLMCEERELCVHADINDEAQTVYVPAVRTTLTEDGGTHEVPGSEKSLLTDVVAFEGVQPGVPLTIRGVLMDAKTGKEALDEKGAQLTATAEFTPTASEGTQDVVFTVDSSKLLGSTLVAFETLHEGTGKHARVLARHADLANRDQTVQVPRIATTATDAGDGDKTVLADGPIEIRDTVTYENLEDGATYTMRGTLYNKATGNPLCDADGKTFTSETELVSKGNGTVEIDFKVSGLDDGVENIVVFESCLRDGREIASHADIKDADQTVKVTHPKPGKTPDAPQTTREKTPRTGDVLAGAFSICVVSGMFLGLAMYLRRRPMRYR